MSWTTVPRTFPKEVGAMTSVASAAKTNLPHGPACTPARMRPACFTNVLRLEICAIFILHEVGLRARGRPLNLALRRYAVNQPDSRMPAHVRGQIAQSIEVKGDEL